MDRPPPLVVVAVLSILAFPVGPPSASAQSNPLMDAHDGGAITDEQADALELSVKEKPDDLATRTKLLGYYFQRRLRSPAAKAARARHALWIIENRPGSEIAASPYARLDRVLDGEAFAKAKELWLRQVERHANDPVVLGNAAEAFSLSDKQRAEELLERAKSLDPKNPDWPRQLAHVYDLQARHAPTLAAREFAEKATAEQQRAIELSPEGTDRFYLLTDLPAMALRAGRPQEAQADAQRLLEEARRHPADWNYGNAIHKGHVALGRVALQAGDTAGAKRHLLEAGKTPGSPQLNSFGPDFTLASELLVRGEREAVTEYLKSIRGFWKSGRDDVDRWLKEIEDGGRPDFSPAGRFFQRRR